MFDNIVSFWGDDNHSLYLNYLTCFEIAVNIHKHIAGYIFFVFKTGHHKLQIVGELRICHFNSYKQDCVKAGQLPLKAL